MTSQEAFDRVCAVFAVQGRPSPSNYQPQSVGALRSCDGLRCAIGALVPDHEYSEALEGAEPQSWVTHVAALDGLQPGFLQALLDAHDDTLGYPTLAGICGNLRRVAHRFNLSDLAVTMIAGWS